MTAADKQGSSLDQSRRNVVIGAAVIAAIAIGLIFFLLLRATGGGPTESVLEGAIRPASPEFEQHLPRIVLDQPEAEEARRALGDIVMTLRTTVRNFTGRTLNGLEIRAAVVDHDGNSIKERTVVVIPTRQKELEPNRTLPVQVMLEGMRDSDVRANIKMEVTAFRFKSESTSRIVEEQILQ